MVFSQDPNIRTSDYQLVPGLRLGSVEASPGDLPAGVVGGTQSLDENAENVVVTNQPGAGDPSAAPVGRLPPGPILTRRPIARSALCAEAPGIS